MKTWFFSNEGILAIIHYCKGMKATCLAGNICKILNLKLYEHNNKILPKKEKRKKGVHGYNNPIN